MLGLARQKINTHTHKEISKLKLLHRMKVCIIIVITKNIKVCSYPNLYNVCH